MYRKRAEKFPGFIQAPASTRKCVMKTKQRNNERKNDVHIKMLLMEGRSLYGMCGKDDRLQRTSGR